MGKIRSLPPILLCVFSLAAVLYLGYDYFTYKSAMMAGQKAQLLQITHKAAQDLDRAVGEVMRGADHIAETLSAPDANAETRRLAEQDLKRTLLFHQGFQGATITYRPHAFKQDQRLYSVYYFRQNGQLAFARLDQLHDYSNGRYPWYTAAMENGSRWSEPYFDETAKLLMITYSAVFHATDAATGKRVPQGVVTIDISLDGMKRIIESFSLGVGGYGALVSDIGTYLYHPTREYAATGRTIMDVAREKNDKDRRFLGEMLRGKRVSSGILDHVSVTTDLPSWMAYEPIPSTGWLLVNTFIKEDVPVDNDRLRRHLLMLTGFGVLFLVSLTFLILHRQDAGVGRLWLMVALASGILTAGMGSVWYFALTHDAQVMKGTPVVHRAEIDDVARRLDADAKRRNADAPIYLPTGILIESLRFADGNDVIYSGQIWQRIGAGMPEGIVPGFILLSAEDVKTTEIYRHSAAGQTMVRWQFQARIRQHLRHVHYPFEREDLTIGLIAKDLAHRVILVPDLSAHVLNNPAALPGLAANLPVPGWEIEKSFFDLSKKVEGLSLAVDAESGLGEEMPVLRFNVLVKKHFLDSFVSNQFPLIVVSIMLFALLVTTTTDEKLMDKMKTTAGMALSMSSALIFIVVFSHIGIRRVVVSDDIFYLEYFYFVMYVAILLVALVSIAHALQGKHDLPHYKDTHLVRLFYWPAIFGTLFVITLGVFY